MISFKLETMDMNIYSEQMSYYQEQLDLSIRIRQVIVHWIRMLILSIKWSVLRGWIFFLLCQMRWKIESRKNLI